MDNLYPALRVSDRSGTPQAGNPAEEYSGERDTEALRGGTPKPIPDNHSSHQAPSARLNTLTLSRKQHL